MPSVFLAEKYELQNNSLSPRQIQKLKYFTIYFGPLQIRYQTKRLIKYL